MSIADDSLENSNVDFNEVPDPAGQEGFSMHAQRDNFLGGGGKAEVVSNEDAAAKAATFLQFAKHIDADRGSQPLGEKIGTVVDKLYFQQEQPPQQGRIARLLGRPSAQAADMAADRQRTLVEALQRSPSHAKVALLKEVMPRFSSLGGGGLVEDFTKIVDYDFDTGAPKTGAHTSQEPLTDEQAHAQVDAFLGSIRQNDVQKGEVAGRGLAPDVSVSVDKALQDNPSLRDDLDHRLQRQGLSTMKAQLLMKVMPSYSPHVKGGIDSDLAKVIDYKPSSPQSASH